MKHLGAIASAHDGRVQDGVAYLSTQWCHGGDRKDGLRIFETEDGFISFKCHTRGSSCRAHGERLEQLALVNEMLRRAGLTEKPTGGAVRKKKFHRRGHTVPVAPRQRLGTTQPKPELSSELREKQAFAANVSEAAPHISLSDFPPAPVKAWFRARDLGTAHTLVNSAARFLSVDFLSQRSRAAKLGITTEKDFAGCMVFDFADRPDGEVVKIGLCGITTEGQKSFCFGRGENDKRLRGNGAHAFSWLYPRSAGGWEESQPRVLHVVEGGADALRVLRYAWRRGWWDAAAVCWQAQRYHQLRIPAGVTLVMLWPDGDAAGALRGVDARKKRQDILIGWGERFKALGGRVLIADMPDDEDPGSMDADLLLSQLGRTERYR